jgi:hypothetical protein
MGSTSSGSHLEVIGTGENRPGHAFKFVEVYFDASPRFVLLLRLNLTESSTGDGFTGGFEAGFCAARLRMLSAWSFLAALFTGLTMEITPLAAYIGKLA